MSMKIEGCVNCFDNNWMSVIDREGDYALELWIVKTKDEETKNNIIYGRSFLFSFSNDKWNYSSNNNYKQIGNEGLQLLRISLYTQGVNLLKVMDGLAQGWNITTATRNSGLEVSSSFEKEIGNTCLNGPVITKPGYYMFNRDAAHSEIIKSPHFKTGAYCYALSQSEKFKLLSFDNEIIAQKASYIFSELKKQIGIDFRGANSSRVGDVEIINFPLADAYHKSSLEVKVGQEGNSIDVSFKSQERCDDECYRASIKIFNSHRLIFSSLSKKVNNIEGVVMMSIQVEKEIIAMIDTLECELYASKGISDEFKLITQWNMPYIREVSVSSNILGNSAIIENKWLSKGLKKDTPKNRINSASVVNTKRDKPSRIVSREDERWVINDRECDKIVSKIYPETDNGGFFQRISFGDSSGRLEFSEWLQKTLGHFEQGHVVFFDPYFEDAGLRLFASYLSPLVDCTIFTTNPEEGSDRLNNIINFVNEYPSLLNSKKITITGMRDGKLHDRYLILINENGLAEKGFHFSNSLQRANINYPLLVTPIPQNTLLKVVEYCEYLFNEVSNDEAVDDDKKFTDIITPQIINERIKKPGKINSQLSDEPGIREFLTLWLKDEEFLTIQEGDIKNRLESFDLLEGNHFKDSIEIPLKSILEMDADNAYKCWEGLSSIFARSHIFDNLELLIPKLSEADFRQFINDFLLSKFEVDAKYSSEVIPLSLLKSDVKTLMSSSRHVEHFSSFMKDKNLSWGDYYAIKSYLTFYPEEFIIFVDDCLTNIKDETKISFFIINHCVSEIATYTSIFNNEIIGTSSNVRSGLLIWFEINEIVKNYLNRRKIDKVKGFISDKNISDKIAYLGWFANAIKKERNGNNSISEIVEQLSLLLCDHKEEYSAKDIMDSVRGHMTRFGWNVSWGYNDYIAPLIKNGLITSDDFCVAIHDELYNYFNEVKERYVSFDISREGIITAIAANFLLSSTPETQMQCLSKMLKILQGSKAIIQRPFENSIDWERWDSARFITLWCKAYITFIKRLCFDKGLVCLDTTKIDDVIEFSMNFIGEDPDINFKKDYLEMSNLYDGINLKHSN
ncbi:hypothetical protein IAE30_12345 [Pantoea sp. S61]|uniref:VPA1262 family protein n=1 Tax=Pantoea sp. S61 TaxID=2767442 RepID=UPI00190B77B9|nr:VPA1262 family protein [Pantoea sp. S61]MBK0124536.1 hypothetical protein [Pantoea sp. S61]